MENDQKITRGASNAVGNTVDGIRHIYEKLPDFRYFYTDTLTANSRGQSIAPVTVHVKLSEIMQVTKKKESFFAVLLFQQKIEGYTGKTINNLQWFDGLYHHLVEPEDTYIKAKECDYPKDDAVFEGIQSLLRQTLGYNHEIQ